MVNKRQGLTKPKMPAQQQKTGTANLLATWSHPDSLEPLIKVWNNAINWW
jgi:hypothetical protein